MLRKIITFVIFSAILFSSFSLHVYADYEPNEDDASVGAYLLYNIENDMVMAEKDASKTIPLSSTVKIMTACIALESGVDLTAEVTITEEMVKNVSGRFMGLKVGDKLTFEDLLYATVCASFNDATQALALSVYPTLDVFVCKMNEKAKALGMNSTTYVDSTGLEAKGAVTTVGDLLKLAKYMSQNDEFVKIASTKSYRFSSLATCDYTTISNRSSLLSTFKGISNFNCGASGGNGDSAVHYYKKNGLSFIIIVMNAKAINGEDKSNFADIYTKNLISHALNDYSTKIVADSNKSVTSQQVKLSISNDEIMIYPKNNLEVFLPNDIDITDDLTFNIDILHGELTAPLKNGDIVGILVVSHNGKLLGSVELIVKSDVERNTFLFALESIKLFVTSRFSILLIIFIVLLVVLYHLNKIKRLNRMYRKKKSIRK